MKTSLAGEETIGRMTCIAGLVHEGKVYIGGDSAGIAGLDMVVLKNPKVFKNGPFLMAFTGSVRAALFAQYALVPPKRHQDEDALRYMVTTFTDALRNCWKAGGFARTENGGESGGWMLVGYEGRLFAVYNEYQVNEAANEYAAMGCGDGIAHGALFATKGQPPEQRIRIALVAAERHSAGVRAPFVIESI